MRTDSITLYVIHSTRAPALVADSISAARWASRYPHNVVVVTTPDRGEEYEQVGADLIATTTDVPKNAELLDFNFNVGLQLALNKDIKFDQAICLRDTAICCQPSVDKWFVDYFYNHEADLIGVAEKNCYAENFLKITDFLAGWRIPHDAWEYAPSTYTVHPASFVLSYRLVKEFFYYGLLLPSNFEKWPLPYSCYMSWVTQILHFHHDLLGSVERPEPPFYIGEDYGAVNPSPHILSNEFLIYYSLKNVRGYPEQTVRNWCKESRAAE